MALKMRPTGLGHGVYKESPTTASSAASGASVASMKPAPALPICALVPVGRASGRHRVTGAERPDLFNRLSSGRYTRSATPPSCDRMLRAETGANLYGKLPPRD